MAESSQGRSLPASSLGGAMPPSAEAVPRPNYGSAFALAIAAAIALKLALLFTSQSLADGDEAVEGLMALHILRDGVHPIYPYGVSYGAGAGVEAHLAVVFFAIFGPSSVALKAVGLCFWLVSGGLLRAIASSQWGTRAGWIALVAWGLAPFATEWSLKVAGGHNVSVALVLLALWLGLCRERRYTAACVVPVAVIAHPVALPVSLGVAAALVLRAPSRERAGIVAAFALASGLVLALLWPEGEGVWNPASRGFEPAAIARALPHVAAGLFSANLNAQSLPGLFDAGVALLWGLVVAASLGMLAVRASAKSSAPNTSHNSARDGVWLLPVVTSLFALLIVRPDELAARHLLPVLPILCLLLGRFLGGLRPAVGLGLLAILALSGTAVQLRELAAPEIHGAGPHGRGVERQNVLELLTTLEREGVRHVYSGDAMLQWMLIFESRERVIARWREPLGRLPRYPLEVDRARLAGRPTRLVVVEGRPEAGEPLRFEIRPIPNAEWVERVFPQSGAPLGAESH